MMERFSETRCDVYEYLLSVGVLQVFGFKVHRFQFDYLLSKNNFKNMSKLLEDHKKNFDMIQQPTQQQAYILNLALCCVDQKETAIRHALDIMSGELGTELQKVCAQTVDGSAYVDNLHNTVDELLKDEHKKLNEQTLVYNIKSQLHELEGCETKKAVESEDKEEENLDQRVQVGLEILGMKKYYPQKLSFEDVIKLRTDDFDDVNKRCTDFRQLPWYFVKHVIGLDSDTRDKCHIKKNGSVKDRDDHDSDESSDDDDEDNMNDVNPLDLIYIIFLCSDDFLRQELVEKMTQCQYAVPFILPSPMKTANQPGCHILQWSLERLTKTFYQNNVVVNKPLMNVEAPLITCMSIGEETSWKSRLLNKMLSPQQETFWHQGLKGGTCKQVLSRDMVELAWYLPGKDEIDLRASPLIFANVRQTSEQSEIMCDTLMRSSSVSCVFAEEVDEQLDAFLEKRKDLP